MRLCFYFYGGIPLKFSARSYSMEGVSYSHILTKFCENSFGRVMSQVNGKVERQRIDFSKVSYLPSNFHIRKRADALTEMKGLSVFHVAQDQSYRILQIQMMDPLRTQLTDTGQCGSH